MKKYELENDILDVLGKHGYNQDYVQYLNIELEVEKIPEITIVYRCLKDR